MGPIFDVIKLQHNCNYNHKWTKYFVSSNLSLYLFKLQYSIPVSNVNLTLGTVIIIFIYLPTAQLAFVSLLSSTFDIQTSRVHNSDLSCNKLRKRSTLQLLTKFFNKAEQLKLFCNYTIMFTTPRWRARILVQPAQFIQQSNIETVNVRIGSYSLFLPVASTRSRKLVIKFLYVHRTQARLEQRQGVKCLKVVHTTQLS